MEELKKIIETQKRCCSHYSTQFVPPSYNNMVVISDGVYEGGEPVEGVRYPSPPHMSGWWLTTNKYNGDSRTLKTVHYQHIIEERPDLAIYMALPYGYRFMLGGEKDFVWFDVEIEKDV